VVASPSSEMPFLFYYAKNNVWKAHEELVDTLRVDVEMIDDFHVWIAWTI
jgi:hypothetical protein